MDAVEDIKSRLSIEDVIGEYVQLKRSGRNFKGLSPFSSEKSPSFMVSPEKQIWHDFSSGKGGDMISFIMEVEGLDFRETLDLLARKAGIDLSQYRGSRGSSNSKQKERLYEALEMAARFYQVQFSKTKDAYEYVLGKRQFSKDTALEWKLGYSPSSGTALMDYLLSRDFSLDELKAAGLVTQRYKGPGDMFRGRIMIPLQDPQGRVIGFTARLLADDKNAPKYINTPQTILYDKSRHVYGLHLAKDAMRKLGYVVLVEGNLDVIASHQVGVRQVVATAGTALTEANMKAMSRFTEDVRLSFDADKAGVAATERAIPIASKVGVSLSIITIPTGKDPDELIKQSKDTWQEIIDQPQYALDWLVERYQSLLDVTSAKGKKEFSDILLPIIRKLQDSVEQDHYMEVLAKVLGVSRDALDKKLIQQPGRDPVPVRKAIVATPAQINRASVDYQKTQDHMMALLLLHPTLRDKVTLLTEDMFVAGQAKYLFRYLQKYQAYVGDASDITEGLDDKQVQSFRDYAKILVLQHEELYGNIDMESIELRYEITRLQARLVEQYIKHEKQNLMLQMGQADQQMTRPLLVRVKELDTLLNKAQQAQGGERG